MIAEGDAWGQVTPDGTLVASCLILPYGSRIGWIAMVLTAASHRRQGLASANLRLALERCEARGLIAGLDATPAGREVYGPLGFKDALCLQRLVAERPTLRQADHRDPAIRPLRTTGDLERIARLDAGAFGAKRQALLAHLRGMALERAHLAHARGRLSGFVLARPGRASLHVGPLVAEEDAIAQALLERAVVGSAGPVSIDVPKDRAGFLAFLARAGFAPARTFTRMFKGAPAPIGDPASCHAIAGPEFG
jgi:Acetyltransferase (GNAT) domain/Acetyltransferase (GNAT) family